MKEKKIKEKNKDGKSIIPGAIIVGLIAAIILYVVMLNAEKNALADFEKGITYVATKDIPKGTLLQEENYAEYFELKELDKDFIPEKAISSPEQLYNLITRNGIDKGTLITSGMFDSVNEVTKGMKEPVIAGFKADDLFQVVGGTLRAGDKIHIYDADEEGVVNLTWSDVYVQQVFDNTGAHITNDDEQTAAQRVNVYMDKKDIEDFYTKLATGTLRVVKVCD